MLPYKCDYVEKLKQGHKPDCPSVSLDKKLKAGSQTTNVPGLIGQDRKITTDRKFTGSLMYLTNGRGTEAK